MPKFDVWTILRLYELAEISDSVKIEKV